jgi:hypothetical protein
LDVGAVLGILRAAIRNLKDRNPNFIRDMASKVARGRTIFPEHAMEAAWLLARLQGSQFAIGPAHTSAWVADSAKYCPRFMRNYIDLDPALKDRWGIPTIRFHYKFGDNEKEDVPGHGQSRAGDVRRRLVSRSSMSIETC